jgi:hypothetical protein
MYTFWRGTKYIKTIHYKEKRIIELVWCISLIGLLQFPLPVIGNGEADTYKQLFLFNITYDMLILTSIAYCLTKATSVIKSSNVFKNRVGTVDMK